MASLLAGLLVLTGLTWHSVADSARGRAAEVDAARQAADGAPPAAALSPSGEGTAPPSSAHASTSSSAARAERVAGISAHAAATALPTALNKTAIDAHVAALTSALGAGGVSVAAINMSTGSSYNYGATGGMWTGSIVKLDILETLLLQHQDAGQFLSSTEVTEATTMIENSDNDAASDLWSDVGNDPAATLANKQLGPVNTVMGTGGYWGLTTTDATDQLALLKNLVSPGPLDAASQAFALNLMRNVEADQRWGVGVVADPGTTFANKNGWLAVDNDNDLWLVNSLGIVTINGQQVLMAVLTQHDDSEDDGIALVQSLAKVIAPAVAP